MKIAALLLALPVLAACSRHRADPAPDPTPTFTYTSQLAFAAPRPALGATYAPPQLSAWATTTATLLRVRLGASSAESVVMEVPLAALTSQWVGTYALRCPARPTDPADVAYYYYATPGSWSVSDFGIINNSAPLPLVGGFAITAYDADRHLLSGHYAVQASHQLDPTNASSLEYCDIALSGEFANVKIDQ